MSKAVCIYCGKTMKMEAKDGYTYRCGDCVEASFDAYKQNHDDKLRRLAQLEAIKEKARALLANIVVDAERSSGRLRLDKDTWKAIEELGAAIDKDGDA